MTDRGSLGTIVTVAALGMLQFLRVAAVHGWLTRQLKTRSVEREVGGPVFVAGLRRSTIS